MKENIIWTKNINISR